MRAVTYFYFSFTHEFKNVLFAEYFHNFIKRDSIFTFMPVTPTHYVIDFIRASRWPVKCVHND